MGELAFRKIQYGKEVTRGTAVAATRMFAGEITVPVDRKRQFPQLTTGTRARATKGVFNQFLVDGMVLKTQAFQMLPMIFSMGLKGGVVASEVTALQADYLWDFTPSLTGANSPNAFTTEYGDDTEQYEVEYTLARSIKIAGGAGQDAPVTVEASCFGRQISDSAFTGALTFPDVDLMVANLTKIYVDGAWANLGGTQKTGLLVDWSIEIMTGLHPKFMADGTLYFGQHGEGPIDVLATFTFEGNSEADSLWDAFRAGTQKAIRVETIGEQIGTGTNHSLVVDVFGEFGEVVPLARERDGNNLHTAIFHGVSDNQATPRMLAVKCTTDRNAV